MDGENAYSGEQSPAVALDPEETRGTRQAGLAVKSGESYTGRTVLSADRGRAEITLVWGDGQSTSGSGPAFCVTGNDLRQGFEFNQ